MISVVTLTYNRTNFLEEAVNSFVLQNNTNFEMVIVNDKHDLTYTIDHPNIKVINLKNRTSCILEKLMIGFKHASNEYIYRLDDDDLLAPNALFNCSNEIKDNPGYDLYRSKSHYVFVNNKFEFINDNINNGNIFRKTHYLNISHPHRSIDEDVYLYSQCDAKIFAYDFISMIYRWGMNTFHISGYGIIPTQELYNNLLNHFPQEEGHKNIVPNWKEDYWKLLPVGTNK